MTVMITMGTISKIIITLWSNRLLVGVDRSLVVGSGRVEWEDLRREVGHRLGRSEGHSVNGEDLSVERVVELHALIGISVGRLVAEELVAIVGRGRLQSLGAVITIQLMRTDVLGSGPGQLPPRQHHRTAPQAGENSRWSCRAGVGSLTCLTTPSLSLMVTMPCAFKGVSCTKALKATASEHGADCGMLRHTGP